MKELFDRKWWVVLLVRSSLQAQFLLLHSATIQRKNFNRIQKNPLTNLLIKKELKSHIDLLNAKYDQIVARNGSLPGTL
ncbi:hypothetical protein ACUIAK_14315 [Bacillus cytotoxicus]